MCASILWRMRGCEPTKVLGDAGSLPLGLQLRRILGLVLHAVAGAVAGLPDLSWRVVGTDLLLRDVSALLLCRAEAARIGGSGLLGS